MPAGYKADGTLRGSEWAARGPTMAERVVYPAMFIKTIETDDAGNEIVEYEGESFSEPGGAATRVSGRCADAIDPISRAPYDTNRPGFVLQPYGDQPGLCFQEDGRYEADKIRYIWENGNPISRTELSEENRAYLESKIAPPYPWEPFPYRMRLHLLNGSIVEIPCNEISGVEPGNMSKLDEAVRIEISLGVTALEVAVFAYHPYLVAITLPESVKRIAKSAFSNCTSLAEITLPTTLTTIEEFAFLHCTKFNTIVLPDGVTTIGKNAFERCTSLAEINVPEGVTRIQDRVFYGCTSLRSITLPTKVTSIGFGAFEGCTSLASINIPEGVTTIGESAFEGCTSLESILFPSSVETYGKDMLLGCTSLRHVYLANNSGQQQVDVANLGVDPDAVTIYRGTVSLPRPRKLSRARKRRSEALRRGDSDSDSDSDANVETPLIESPPLRPSRARSPQTSRLRTEGMLYDWTGGRPGPFLP